MFHGTEGMEGVELVEDSREWVTGSNPVRLTTKINNLAEIIDEPIKPWVPNGFQNRALYWQLARACTLPVSF